MNESNLNLEPETDLALVAKSILEYDEDDRREFLECLAEMLELEENSEVLKTRPRKKK